MTAPAALSRCLQLEEEELSEEDAKLKEDLELLVTRAADTDAGVAKLAIDSLGTEIRSAGLASRRSKVWQGRLTRRCSLCSGFSLFRRLLVPARHFHGPLLCRTATSSMTSVPKPLKFLRPHYDALKARLDGLPAGAPNRQELADVVRWVVGRV